ncbi:hypothetical protein TRVL_10251 [Trypanosoma vivax]|nr:hypothetical protein TRVL_10251 [Trypanosoma vivax]
MGLFKRHATLQPVLHCESGTSLFQWQCAVWCTLIYLERYQSLTHSLRCSPVLHSDSEFTKIKQNKIKYLRKCIIIDELKTFRAPFGQHCELMEEYTKSQSLSAQNSLQCKKEMK